LTNIDLGNLFPRKPGEVSRFCLLILKGLGLIYFLDANGNFYEVPYIDLFDAGLRKKICKVTLSASVMGDSWVCTHMNCPLLYFIAQKQQQSTLPKNVFWEKEVFS